MLDGHPPARAARSAFSQLPADDERKDRAAGAPEGDSLADLKITSPENTIRTHSKRIYAKLDVHKKQELIDMLKAVEL